MCPPAAELGEIIERFGRDHQVPFGVADEVLHDPLARRVVGLAEVRAEPVVGGEGHVVRGGHDHVRDDPALQARHPVGEDLARDPAEDLEALRQHAQRRLGAFIGGEAHEPDPGEGQHRAEHVDPTLGAPIDDQVLTRGPHRRATPPVIVGAPQPFLRRDQATEVPRRPAIARGLREWEQPLRADPTRALHHPLRDQHHDPVVVPLPRLADREHPAGLVTGDDPLHRLRRRPRHRGGTTVRTHLTVGRNDVHTFPRRLQWSSLGGAVTG